jgi:hypothetical protein
LLAWGCAVLLCSGGACVCECGLRFARVSGGGRGWEGRPGRAARASTKPTRAWAQGVGREKRRWGLRGSSRRLLLP